MYEKVKEELELRDIGKTGELANLTYEELISLAYVLGIID